MYVDLLYCTMAAENIAHSLRKIVLDFSSMFPITCPFTPFLSFHIYIHYTYSILSGGFMAAAQYLHLPDSPLSLTAALVDSDRGALESLLGIVPHNTGEWCVIYSHCFCFLFVHFICIWIEVPRFCTLSSFLPSFILFFSTLVLCLLPNLILSF